MENEEIKKKRKAEREHLYSREARMIVETKGPGRKEIRAGQRNRRAGKGGSPHGVPDERAIARKKAKRSRRIGRLKGPLNLKARVLQAAITRMAREAGIVSRLRKKAAANIAKDAVAVVD